MIGSVCHGYEQACAWRIEGFFIFISLLRKAQISALFAVIAALNAMHLSYHQEPQKSHVVLHSKPAISTKGLDAMSPLLLRP